MARNMAFHGRTRDTVRGDAWRGGSGEVVRVMSWRKFWNVQKFSQRCHDLSGQHCEVHMRDIGCHPFCEHFVTYAWQMARRGENYASPCCLGRLCATPL